MDIYQKTICVNVYPKKGKISLQTYFDFAGFKTEKHNDWFTAKGTVRDFMEFCKWSLEHITNHLSGSVLNVRIFQEMVESMSIENADSILNKILFSKIYCGKVKGNGIYCDKGETLFLFDKEFSTFFDLEDSNIFVIYQMPEMTMYDSNDHDNFMPIWTTLLNHNSLDVYSPNKFLTAGSVTITSILEHNNFFLDVYSNLKDLSCNELCEKLNINIENKELYKNLMKRYSNINA